MVYFHFISSDRSSCSQSVTYRYRKFPVPGIFNFFGGIGTVIGTNWYRKKVSEPVSVKFGTDKKSRNRYRQNLVPEKVSEPVSEKFDTGTEFRRQNLGILKIYNGYWFRICLGEQSINDLDAQK